MRRNLIAPLVAVIMLSSACGGDTEVPQATPSAAPTTPVSPVSEPALTPGRLSAWRGCKDGFECATLTAPLDNDDATKGTIALAVTRHRASGQNRIGSLLVNPGGPGASAVEFLQDNLRGIFPSDIRSRFDLVAFDPRGVGQTAPVQCLSTSELDRYFHLDPTPDDAAEQQAYEAGNKKLAAGCVAKSARVLPYVNTTVVAQDMERVRLALKEPKISYLGYSYGTAIGAAYLDKFPGGVRAMVLDGAVDPTLTWDQLLAGQSKGFDVALNAFLKDCEQIRCEFRQAVRGDLFAAYDALAAKVERSPLPGVGRRTVGPGEFSLGVGDGLYSRDFGWPQIASALSRAQQGDGAELLAMNDNYLQRTDKGYANITEANIAVNCTDRPWPKQSAPYVALAREVAKTSPRFGPAISLSGLSCAAWPIASVGVPHKVVAPTSPPIVVIGTTRDPATPYVWSQGLAGQLANGILLTYKGDGHTVYRAGAPRCIVDPVRDYLISLTAPEPTRC